MELYQLLYFKKVAEYANLTKASEALFISQPALTKAIHKLEEELGATLFDRKGKSVSINSTGEIVLDYADNILYMADAMRKAVSSKNIQKHFTVITNLPNIFRFFAPIWAAETPSLNVQYFDSRVIKAELFKHNPTNIAITDAPIEGEFITSRLILDDLLLINLPVKSPLLKKETISPQDINGMQLIMPKYTANDVPNRIIKQALKNHSCKVNFIPSLDIAATDYLLESSNVSFITSAFTSLYYSPTLRAERIIKAPSSSIPYYLSYNTASEKLLLPALDVVQRQFDGVRTQLSERFPCVYAAPNAGI